MGGGARGGRGEVLIVSSREISLEGLCLMTCLCCVASYS